ncbi:MAG: hypothetical protein ACRDQG_14265, partial [Pseudonocardiaceae bacterium]
PSAAEYKGAYGLLEARANVDEGDRVRYVYDAESPEPPADIKVRDLEGDVWSSTVNGWTRGNDPVSWPALLVMTDARHHPLVEWREGDPR